MKFYLIYHSIISDWNHGNAHFLRGIVSALQDRGHSVKVLEPENGWSLTNLVKHYGEKPIEEFNRKFPNHQPYFYNENKFNPEEFLADADVVIVHEWNNPALVKKVGEYRAKNDHFLLFFHDTHHRSVTQPKEIKNYDLKHYDAVLAFGDIIRKKYKQKKWAKHVFTWHEAADTRIFHPVKNRKKEGDLVWIGNWGDNERTEELREFIINPSVELGLKTVFYGVRYPEKALKILKEANIEYRGWLPNYKVPEVFSAFNFTVHVPRRPYVQKLHGIPTIRPFEAMACGIPLICSEWNDAENLFEPGKDYLVAESGMEMKNHMQRILADQNLADELSSHALATIREKHTCDHRVEELYRIIIDLPEKNLERSILNES